MHRHSAPSKCPNGARPRPKTARLASARAQLMRGRACRHAPCPTCAPHLPWRIRPMSRYAPSRSRVRFFPAPPRVATMPPHPCERACRTVTFSWVRFWSTRQIAWCGHVGRSQSCTRAAAVRARRGAPRRREAAPCVRWRAAAAAAAQLPPDGPPGRLFVAFAASLPLTCLLTSGCAAVVGVWRSGGGALAEARGQAEALVTMRRRARALVHECRPPSSSDRWQCVIGSRREPAASGAPLGLGLCGGCS